MLLTQKVSKRKGLQNIETTTNHTVDLTEQRIDGR